MRQHNITALRYYGKEDIRLEQIPSRYDFFPSVGLQNIDQLLIYLVHAIPTRFESRSLTVESVAPTSMSISMDRYFPHNLAQKTLGLENLSQ